MASGQGLNDFDPVIEKREELAAGWAWRLVHERGRTATVTPEDRMNMLNSGLRIADFAFVERMIRMVCRQLSPEAAEMQGLPPGTLFQSKSDGGVIFNRDTAIAEVGVMAGIDMTPSSFKHVDRILLEARAALAFKRAGKVPESLKRAAEIADQVDPWRFRDVDEEALNRALIRGGFDPFTPTMPPAEPPIDVSSVGAPEPVITEPQGLVSLTPIDPQPVATSLEAGKPQTTEPGSVSDKSEAPRNKHVAVAPIDAIPTKAAPPAAGAVASNSEGGAAAGRAKSKAARPDFSAALGARAKSDSAADLPPPDAPVKDFLSHYFNDRKRQLSKGGVKSIRGAVRVLHEVLGPVSFTDVTRRDARYFADVTEALPKDYARLERYTDGSGRVLSLPERVSKAQQRNAPVLSLKTVGKHLSNLKGIWKWAIEAELYPAGSGNPFDFPKKVAPADLPVGEGGSRERKSWDDKSLRTYLTGPVHMGCGGLRSRMKAGRVVIRDALYWAIPTLFLCMMRRGELFQLRVRNVQAWTSVDGVQCWYFDLEDPNIHVKGKAASKSQSASRRPVPIHSALVELGFIRDHVEGRDPDELVFPELKPRDGDYGHYIGNRLREYAKACEVFVEGMDTHSLRRTANTQLRRKFASPDSRSQLLGHAVRLSPNRASAHDRKAKLLQTVLAIFEEDDRETGSNSPDALGERINGLLGQSLAPGERETVQAKHYLDGLSLNERRDLIETLTLPVGVDELNSAWDKAETRIVVLSARIAKLKGLKRA